MAQIPVDGAVVFKDGSAYLKISPKSDGMTGTSSNFPGFGMGSSSSNSNPPWPLSKQRSDQKILDAINNCSVTVHQSRLPMSSTDLRVMLNNIQSALGLNIGLQGEWSLKTDHKLMELLAKAKGTKRKATAMVHSELSICQLLPPTACKVSCFHIIVRSELSNCQLNSVQCVEIMLTF